VEKTGLKHCQSLDGTRVQVLVVGGGPAGIGAALAAARASAQTLLVENYGFFGGVAAAIAATERVVPRQIEVGKLREALRRDGVNLERAGDPQGELINRG